jgi:hypothetical protein
LGFGLARFLLFGSWLTRWGILVFPAWVLVVNLYILIDNLRRAPGEAEGNPASKFPYGPTEGVTSVPRQLGDYAGRWLNVDKPV